MKPEAAWDIAQRLEELSRNLRGLALKAYAKHKRLAKVSLPVKGVLFPMTLEGAKNELHDILSNF